MIAPASLMQIADSAFPTGAFAYSHGLEALARAGRFPDAAALESYLDAYLGQALSFDLAFVAEAHAAAGDEGRLVETFHAWDAFCWNHAIRRASLRQGQALLALLRDCFPDPGLDALAERAVARDWPLHFAPTLGAGLSRLEAACDEACRVYLHGLARDQIAAAMRLGLLGPRAGQTMQARILARADTAWKRRGLPSQMAQARRNAPLVEVGQGCHGFLYSRLFQN